MTAAVDEESLRDLRRQIETVQALMIPYVTGHPAKTQPIRYIRQYNALHTALEAAGYCDPNPHSSLEEFWAYCKVKGMKTYAARRTYVRELYADILLDIERRLSAAGEPPHWGRANECLVDELEPVRRQWLKAKNFICANPPDFENSIKESINSIESVLKILTGNAKATLGDMIGKVRIDKDTGKLMSQAYGLVSNKDFVRHGGTIAQELTKEDAEFFLEFAAVCNTYLTARLKKPGKQGVG